MWAKPDIKSVVEEGFSFKTVSLKSLWLDFPYHITEELCCK